MICKPCGDTEHQKCANAKRKSERPTWCDCQHKKRAS